MHFLIDGRALQSSVRSGIPRITEQIINALASHECEHQFTVLTTGFKSPNLELPENFGHVHLHLPNKLLHASIRALGLPKFDEIVAKVTGILVDCCLLPNLHFFASKKPYVLLIHDLAFYFAPQLLTIKERLAHSLKQPARLIQNSAELLVMSESTNRDLKSLFGRTGHPIMSASPQQVEQNSAGSDFVFIGSFEPRKNIETLLQAFNYWKKISFSSAKLHLIGKTNQLKNIYQATDIVFHGMISDEKRDEILNQCGTLILPSYYEGFGLPIVEAAKRGLKIIASFAGSLPEIAPANTIFMDPLRVSSAVEAFKIAVTQSASPSHYNSYAPNAKVIVEVLEKSVSHDSGTVPMRGQSPT